MPVDEKPPAMPGESGSFSFRQKTSYAIIILSPPRHKKA